MLTGKTAVITGASRGIGKAIALRMAENGANVAIIYGTNDEAANSVCQRASEAGVLARCYRCDVADYSLTEETVKSIIDDFGGVDILVNNAGITDDRLLVQMSEESFSGVINVNLKGAFNMTRHLSRHFIKRRSGRIINITSVIGLMGNAGQANYAAAKAGLIGLTKSAARELGPRGITCNAIAPGFIETDMTGKMSESAREELLKNIPLKRAGTAEDVAGLALFLASGFSQYITGEVIKVDGGLYI